MGLEVYTGLIKDMDQNWPTGTDPKSQGDDHIRGIKLTMQTDCVSKEEKAEIIAEIDRIDGELLLKAPLDSPAFTGVPTAPTAASGTSTTQIATTEFVVQAGLGSAQTWQDVKATRAFNADYTNDTGKPIMVSACTANSSQNVGFNVLVGGVTIYTDPGTASVSNSCTFIVPDGVVYRINCNRTLATWAELR